MPTTRKRSKPFARAATPADRLASELREIALLSSLGSLAGWDQETMMPRAGAGLRADQRAALSALVHERRTSKRLGEMISQAESWAKRRGSPALRADVREVRRDYERATKLPASLVAEIARCSSLGMEAWKEARRQSKFRLFLPWLEKSFDLARQKARCYGRPPGGKPGARVELYDSLLDEYEPDMTAAEVERIFTPLRERLTPLIDRVKHARRKPSEAPARITTSIEDQKRFVRLVCGAIGFDFGAGRMDESTHPFCEGLGPGDTRITNRYRPDGWTDSLSTAMHESGHAMYEQGLPKEDHFGLPRAEAVSLGIHESQSRLWENLVGRSRAFWRWARKQAIGVFGRDVARFSAEDLYRAVNIVRPNFIRVESDELTYNLHIMLRFDIERALVNGRMNSRDLPEVWNERIKSDLGLKVPNDRLGCLQDVHWSAGLIGYFPTYTLGNLYGAQIWEAIKRNLPSRDRLLERGAFKPILNWLRKNIHAHGRRYPAPELCRRATGSPLTHDPLLRHLERKVEAVYGRAP